MYFLTPSSAHHKYSKYDTSLVEKGDLLKLYNQQIFGDLPDNWVKILIINILYCFFLLTNNLNRVIAKRIHQFQHIHTHTKSIKLTLHIDFFDGQNRDSFDRHIEHTLSYRQRVEASLQVRPVLVFLSSWGVELAPPVHKLLFLLVTYLGVRGQQVNNGPQVLNLNVATYCSSVKALKFGWK